MRVLLDHLDIGSPAPAGIDPICHTYHMQTNWFPRTRGDRPDVLVHVLPVTQVPPHPRG